MEKHESKLGNKWIFQNTPLPRAATAVSGANRNGEHSEFLHSWALQDHQVHLSTGSCVVGSFCFVGGGGVGEEKLERKEITKAHLITVKVTH